MLKADPDTRGIPIIVVTVEDDDGRMRRLGADDHLTKPIAADRLATWLARVGRTELVVGRRATPEVRRRR